MNKQSLSDLRFDLANARTRLRGVLKRKNTKVDQQMLDDLKYVLDTIDRSVKLLDKKEED